MLAQLVRHQASALAASALDFVVMIALVELLRVSPPVAAFVGACCGAGLNFTLGRHWTFRAGASPITGQALRYAVVSGASAGWNALGEWVGTRMLGIEYVLVRLVVSLVVGLAWNYPMQRVFVFGRSTAS